jgi:site-specific DNA recombinase
MLAFLRQRKTLVQYVYVYDFSRWARDLYDHFTVKRQLMSLGITLRSATQPVADNATGRAIEGYISVTNQFVNELQAEKIVECMQETVRRGRWPWRSPLGYLNGRSATGEKIVTLDPERAELMRMAFRMVAEGQAPADVLKRLTAIGLRSRAGRSLRYADFQKLLRNPFYTGMVRAGAWGIETEGQHEPLTDPTTWARVQSRISPRKDRRTYLRQHPDFPLRGFVRCEACGKPLTASWSRGKAGTRYGYYRCWSRHCGAVNIAAGKLEEEFSELLRRVQLTPAMARLVEASLMSLWDHFRAESERAAALVERRIHDIKERKRRLMEAFVYQKAIDRESYDEELSALDEALTIAQLEHHDTRLEDLDLEASLGFAKHVLTNTSRLWQEATTAQRQRLQPLVFPRGVSYGENGIGTPETALIFRLLDRKKGGRKDLVEQKGFEPSTPTLRTWCSPS